MPLTKKEVEYLDWLQDTLIPDLKDSGMEYTAEDFERLIVIVDKLNTENVRLMKPKKK